ncbi:uncharacterized protein LOC128198688 [Bicyclus anynana]|uniref:Uncharacterized protein LOC128198688 n=1 Tax=Bicyclus anynana TaxID=110368 RepID=A0ABM3LPY8_BICAN|nr:uncharacterized protein LOC128198688 [Bicyclus anynana]
MLVLKVVLVALDNLQKCSIKNDECISEMYTNALLNIGSVGIPEINMPPIEPLLFTNVTVKVLDVVTLTLTDGTVKGFSKCQVKKLHIDLDKKSGTQDFLCDLIIKSNVKVEGSDPAIQGLIGTSSLNGMGNLRVKLEKLFMHFDFPITPFKKEDGEIYLKISYKNIKYDFDLEKATFGAEKITVGSQDISKLLIDFLNQNFKPMLKTLGGPIFAKATEFFFHFSKLFYEGIPANKYIIEDLKRYINK